MFDKARGNFGRPEVERSGWQGSWRVRRQEGWRSGFLKKIMSLRGALTCKSCNGLNEVTW